MKKVITMIDSGIIIDIADSTTLMENGDTEVTKDNGVYYIGFPVNVYEVEVIPEDVKPESQTYDGEVFSVNQDYVPPFSSEEEIATLKLENEELKLQMTAMQLGMAELAGIVVGGVE